MLTWGVFATIAAQTELREAASVRAVPQKMQLDTAKRVRRGELKMRPMTMKEAVRETVPTVTLEKEVSAVADEHGMPQKNHAMDSTARRARLGHKPTMAKPAMRDEGLDTT